MPGYLGRIDHFSGNGRMVYFSIAGSNAIGIENWFEGRSVGFIPGVPEPQGVLYVAGFDKIVAASAEGKVYIFDAKTRKLEKSIDFGADADNLRWDPVHKLVLVGFGEDDGGIASIDPATNSRVGKVLKTGGPPGGLQMSIDEPTGLEERATVREYGFQPHRIGLRIDSIVGEREAPRGNLRPIVPAICDDR